MNTHTHTLSRPCQTFRQSSNLHTEIQVTEVQNRQQGAHGDSSERPATSLLQSKMIHFTTNVLKIM